MDAASARPTALDVQIEEVLHKQRWNGAIVPGSLQLLPQGYQQGQGSQNEPQRFQPIIKPPGLLLFQSQTQMTVYNRHHQPSQPRAAERPHAPPPPQQQQQQTAGDGSVPRQAVQCMQNKQSQQVQMQVALAPSHAQQQLFPRGEGCLVQRQGPLQQGMQPPSQSLPSLGLRALFTRAGATAPQQSSTDQGIGTLTGSLHRDRTIVTQQQQQQNQHQQQEQGPHGNEQQAVQKQQQQPPPQLSADQWECHQELPVHAQPPAAAQCSPTAQPRPLRLRLSEWGLPAGVVAAYEANGVKRMYPWQAGALECGEGYNNLIYTAPTSGGKSLVAEVLMVRRLERSKQLMRRPRGGFVPRYGRALLILPYISIVHEKVEHLNKVLAPMRGLTVKGYYGSEEGGQPLAPRGENVAVCTIEKANVAINRLAAEGRLGELCCIVVDELHMVGDGDRGLGLEMLLSKVLFSPHAANITIVGMSATMGGLDALQHWLRAELFMTNYRPVPLLEHAVFRGKVYAKLAKEEWPEDKVPLALQRELEPSDRRDPDRLVRVACMVPLLAEVVREGHSALVFCAGRKSCESCACLVADVMPELVPEQDSESVTRLMKQRTSIVSDIRAASGGGMNEALERCVLRGVAWHHAGLTMQERAGVERAYRLGCLSVVTATSTLAAGINLPARRVVLRSLQQGIGPVSRSQYLQMVGRAGRAGHCPIGESFILGSGPANGTEWQAISRLLTAPVPNLTSRLLPEAALQTTDPGQGFKDKHNMALQQLLLECMANGSVRTGDDVVRLLESTFGSVQLDRGCLHAATHAALRSLQAEKRLIALSSADSTWSVTPKGRAVFDSSLPLQPAMQLYDSLSQAECGLQLGSPLALVYHSLLADQLPTDVQSWAAWQQLLTRLGSKQRAVATAVGIDPSSQELHLLRMGKGLTPILQAKHAKFASALMLCDLMGESSVADVVRRYGGPDFLSRSGISAGQLQKLQADAGKWMAMAAVLCDSAGWWPLAMLYSNLAQTAAAGVRQELLPLMAVPDMCPIKARALWKAALKTPHDLATAEEAVVAKALAACFALQLKARPRKQLKVAATEGPGRGEAEGTGAKGAAAMAARAARALVQAARELVVSSNQALASLAAELAEEQVDEEDAAGEKLSAAEEDELGIRVRAAAASGVAGGVLESAGPSQVSQTEPQGAAAPSGGSVSIAAAAMLRWTQGQSRVVELRSSSPLEQVEQFLQALQLQPRFALALYAMQPQSQLLQQEQQPQPQQPHQHQQRPGAHQRRHVVALAVCWESQGAFFLDLSPRQLARRLASGESLRAALVRLLARRDATVLLHDCCAALPLLAAAGLRLGARVEDPAVAARLLVPGAPAEEAALKALHAKFASQLPVRVPNLAKAGVTATARTALLTLAVAEPLRSLLAAHGMLEAFELLEMPAAAAAASHCGRLQLSCAALHAARKAAQASARYAEQELQRMYSLPISLQEKENCCQILGSLKLPQPPRPKRGLLPAVPLEHLQALVRGCRPHQQRERQVLELMCHYGALQVQVVRPICKLLKLASTNAGVPSRPAAAAQAGGLAACGNEHAHGGTEAELEGFLELQVVTQGGSLTYGPEADAALAALVGVEHTSFLSWGAAGGPQGLTLQQELASGVLSVEQINSTPGGVPVALGVPCWRLSGGRTEEEVDEALAGERQLAAEGLEGQEEVWLCGRVKCVLGKCLRAALDFTQPAATPISRTSMALVCVPALPSDARGSSGSWQAPPPVVELQVPCSSLWRLSGPSAEIVGGGCAPAGDAELPPPVLQGMWVLQGYATAQGLLTSSCTTCRTSTPWLQQQQGQRKGQQSCASSEPQAVLVVRLQHLELLVLAQLSRDPALRLACSVAEPYRHVAACWATAAHQVDIPGSAGSDRQCPMLISAHTAEAAAQALCHGFSHNKLGSLLRCGKQSAAAVAAAFLAAFPALQSFCTGLLEQCDRAGAASTLSGRRGPCVSSAGVPQATAKANIHKAALQHTLAGSVADVIKAAFVSLHNELCTLEQQPGQPAPVIAMVLGPTLVLRCNGGDAAVALTAAAVRRALTALRVGRHTLDMPVAFSLTAGPSLHFLQQQPVLNRIPQP